MRRVTAGGEFKLTCQPEHDLVLDRGRVAAVIPNLPDHCRSNFYELEIVLPLKIVVIDPGSYPGAFAETPCPRRRLW